MRLARWSSTRAHNSEAALVELVHLHLIEISFMLLDLDREHRGSRNVGGEHDGMVVEVYPAL
jgi:hypothetical protein